MEKETDSLDAYTIGTETVENKILLNKNFLYSKVSFDVTINKPCVLLSLGDLFDHCVERGFRDKHPKSKVGVRISRQDSFEIELVRVPFLNRERLTRARFFEEIKAAGDKREYLEVFGTFEEIDEWYEWYEDLHIGMVLRFEITTIDYPWG
jgi:hypothetical protein